MKTKSLMPVVMSVVLMLAGPAAFNASAQDPAPPPAPDYQPLSDQQIDQLLGPIALYPDPLLSEILPAATLPAEIVMADRYMTGGGDPNQADQQPWDASVQALTHYPTVLKYLDDNLAWTTAVGQAFLNQQQQVMDSIQRLRQSAQNVGNLVSTPQQEVVDDGGDIEILPTDPDVVYVPVYQPDDVYYQGGYALGFGVACTIGPWLNCDFDWINHDLRFWDRAHPRPANWWHEQPAQRDSWMARQTVWHPQANHVVAVGGRGDRGWNTPAVRPNAAAVQAQLNQARERQQQANDRILQLQRSDPNLYSRPEPERAAPAPAFQPRAEGAFVGSESARDVRTFSDRGEASMQSVRPAPEPERSAPISRPAPSFGGGGGGARGGRR